MNIIARIISVLVALEGATGLFFPSLMVSSSDEFASADNEVKRRIGAAVGLIGAFLFYLTRVMMARPLPHWIVAVTGIYLLLAGLVMIIFPAFSGKAVAWFYRDREATSFVGSVLLVVGIFLYIII